MKRSTASLATLLLLSACGGGGGGEEAPPPGAVAQPTPIGQQPPTAPTPAAPPPAAPTPAAPAPTPAAPAPAPAPKPPTTAPAPTPASPAPAPVDNRPKIAGASVAKMLSLAVNIPFRGPPITMCAVNPYDQACDHYGEIYGSTVQGDHYSYFTGAYTRPHPFWYYKSLTLSTPSSYQDGSIWLGETVTIRDENNNAIALRKSGGLTVNPGDPILLDVGNVAEWASPGADPYYARLQVGTYKGLIKTCWHLRLPGILRLACGLWDVPSTTDPTAVHYRGELIIDDSNTDSRTNPGPVTFESIR